MVEGEQRAKIQAGPQGAAIIKANEALVSISALTAKRDSDTWQDESLWPLP